MNHRSAGIVTTLVIAGLVGLPQASPAAATTAPLAARASTTAPIAAYSLAAPVVTSASGIVARAVVAAGLPCPRLDVRLVSGQRRSVTMAERARPERTSPAFDSVTVCSAAMPLHASSASIGGVAVPAAMPTRIDRLALLGDSGCRIASWQVQDCANALEWPFARINASIAADRPDAIVVNGDFFYREAACPDAHQAWCGSSPPPVTGLPFDDSAFGWIADALLPMAPLFGAAPIIVTRGNHEACNRGGNGYFLFFDPREGTSSTCAPDAGPTLAAAPTVPTTTYAIDLQVSPGRTLRLAVADSAGGSDTAVSPYAELQRTSYTRAARLTEPRPGRESWLLTHRPIYGYVSNEFAKPDTPFSPWSAQDQGAAAWGLLDNYALVFSSHIHIAQAVQLPGLPGQLVLGNAGTLRDPALGYPLPTQPYTVGPDRTYPAPSWAWVSNEFGYAIARPNAELGSWSLDMRNPLGQSFARCGVRDRSLHCVDR